MTMADDPGPDDDSADTEMFQRFVESGDPEPSAGSNAFRLITLGIGLLVLAALVWLMFQL